MRHNIKGRKLNRTSSHRKALFSNMANSLIAQEQIKTTLPKAKEIKRFVEKLITIGKADSIANKQRVFAILNNENSVNKLFNELAKRYKDRSGGYTRVLKCGFRTGDAAPMAIVALVDSNESVDANENDKNKDSGKKKSEPKK